MMTNKGIRDEILIEAYVRNRMNKRLAGEFEQFFIDRPELLARIEIRQLMVDGLRLSSCQIDSPGSMV